jgi:hypothetical protein
VFTTLACLRIYSCFPPLCNNLSCICYYERKDQRCQFHQCCERCDRSPPLQSWTIISLNLAVHVVMCMGLFSPLHLFSVSDLVARLLLLRHGWSCADLGKQEYLI